MIWDFECLELQHPITGILAVDLFPGYNVHLSSFFKNLSDIQAGEGSCLDGA